MREVSYRTCAFILASVAGLGCEVTAVEDDLEGVFPCEVTEDCPGDQHCVAGTCYLEEPPSILLLSPEEEQALPYAGDGSAAAVAIGLTGAGLQLVDPAVEPDPEYGSGYVVVELDGVEVARFTAGTLEGAVSTADIEFDGQPGAHRLEATAHFADGRPYDGPGATVRRLFWVDDGLPRVGFKSPFPGDTLGLEPRLMEVEIATINFEFVKTTPTMVVANGGHGHIHYGARFPACVDDPSCDNDYIGIIAPQAPAFTAVGQASVPAAPAGAADLSVVLREANHIGFRDENGEPVFETIEILRTELEDDPAD